MRLKFNQLSSQSSNPTQSSSLFTQSRGLKETSQQAMASIFLKPNHPPHYLEATEVYRIAPDTDSHIKLRIASGGAGQSGLIRAFAEGFIKHHMKTTEAAPFAVAWMASDTTMSFNSLALKAVDMSITYHP